LSEITNDYWVSDMVVRGIVGSAVVKSSCKARGILSDTIKEVTC